MLASFVHRLPKRFIKFCIVGSSSMVIDLGLLTLLVELAHLSPYIARTISFCVAVTNGYYWNRRWTFADAPKKRIRHQYTQFVLVNIVGLAINLGVMRLGIGLMHLYFRGALPHFYYLPPTIAAVAVSVFWNFLANKYWTFS